MIRILYFASLREALDCATEELACSPGTVDRLLDQLRARGPAWQHAFDGQILCAINQTLAQGSSPIQDGDEVAFFPPVTGG